MSSQELELERDFLLQSIEDLDREHVSGALDDQEYVDLRDQHVSRAAAVLRSLRPANDIPQAEPKAKVVASWMNHRQGRLWIAGVAVVVLLSVGGVLEVVSKRGAGDTVTGTTANTTAGLLAKAEQQTSNGKAADAVKTYDKVLAIDANNVQALTYKGWLLQLAGLQDQGLASIERAIVLQPKFPDAHFFKGYILLNVKQDPNGAIAEFNLFLANNPPQSMVSLVQEALKDAQARAAAK